MRAKRISSICIFIAITILFTGCFSGKYDPNMTIGEQIKTRHYQGSAENFGKKQLLNEMLECVEDNDVDRMKELFSNYALEENDVLDEEIEQFYHPTSSLLPSLYDILSPSPNSGNHCSILHNYSFVFLRIYK